MARLIYADALHRKVKMETNPYGKPTIDVMEKLVELIAQKVCYTWSESCDEWMPHDCGKCYANDCHISEVADHLISNGVTVQEWISVDDRLPRTNVGVLVYTPRLKNIFEAFYKVDGKWEIFSYRGGEILNDEVTHWMSLPEPPKGE